MRSKVRVSVIVGVRVRVTVLHPRADSYAIQGHGRDHGYG